MPATPAAPVLPLPQLGRAWEWLSQTFAAERDRWILWLPVCFALGIGGYFSLTAEPSLWLGCGAAAALCLAWGIAAWAARAPAILLLAPLAAAACGFAAAEWR